MKKTIFILSLFLASAQSYAQTDTLSVSESPLQFSAYVEAYYTHSFNQGQSRERPSFFYNYTREGEFNVNLAVIQAKFDNGEYRANIGIMGGLYAQYNLSAEQSLFQHIYEANAGISLGKKLWLDAGVFWSHLGFESVQAFDNKTLTRNLMSESSPYFLTGAKLTYQLDQWTLSATLCNGWQSIIDPVYRDPGLGLQVTFEPSDNLTLNYSSYLGDGTNAASFARQYFYFNDFYALWKASNRLSIDAGFDIGWREVREQGGSVDYWWNGVAIVQYKLSDKFYLSARGEYFYDPENIVYSDLFGNRFNIMGWSTNIDWKKSENAMIRFEVRHLRAEDYLLDRNGDRVKDELTLTTSLAVKF